MICALQRPWFDVLDQHVLMTPTSALVAGRNVFRRAPVNEDRRARCPLMRAGVLKIAHRPRKLMPFFVSRIWQFET